MATGAIGVMDTRLGSTGDIGVFATGSSGIVGR